MNTYNKEYWLGLAERWFDGTTTDSEERLLRRFAASETAQHDPDFCDLRAVMGVFASAKGCAYTAAPPRSVALRRSLPRLAAASIAVVAVLTATILWLAQPRNVCIAYVDGERITDRAAVLALMHDSWDDIALAEHDDPVAAQLSDLFQTLDE